MCTWRLQHCLPKRNNCNHCAKEGHRRRQQKFCLVHRRLQHRWGPALQFHWAGRMERSLTSLLPKSERSGRHTAVANQRPAISAKCDCAYLILQFPGVYIRSLESGGCVVRYRVALEKNDIMIWGPQDSGALQNVFWEAGSWMPSAFT